MIPESWVTSNIRIVYFYNIMRIIRGINGPQRRVHGEWISRMNSFPHVVDTINEDLFRTCCLSMK